MKLAVIAAHDKNLAIGKDGKLPWHIPADLKHFKKTTLGFPVLMGRGVYEEIGEKPLPGRKNIVISQKKWDNVLSFSSIEAAIDYLKDEETVFVIGGGMIYRELLPSADYLYITEIDGSFEGDTFFPEYRTEIGSRWVLVDEEKHEGYRFKKYCRSVSHINKK